MCSFHPPVPPLPPRPCFSSFSVPNAKMFSPTLSHTAWVPFPPFPGHCSHQHQGLPHGLSSVVPSWALLPTTFLSSSASAYVSPTDKSLDAPPAPIVCPFLPLGLSHPQPWLLLTPSLKSPISASPGCVPQVPKLHLPVVATPIHTCLSSQGPHLVPRQVIPSGARGCPHGSCLDLSPTLGDRDS